MEGILSQLQPPPGPGRRAKQERMAVRRLRVNEKIARRQQEEMAGMSKSSVISLGRSSLDLITSNGTGTGTETNVSAVAVTSKGTEPEEYDSIEIHEKNFNANAQLEHQIEESKRQLEQLINDGEILITNVKAAAEYREKIRHDKLDETRKQRIADLNDDAKQCQQQYEEISQKWLINAEKTLPLELFEKMKQQQEACDDLLRKKDDTILSLKREIEENDYQYENNLEKYQKDMILMGDRVDDHIDDLRKSFLEELELIEDYTCEDRLSILEENQSETVGWLKVLSDFETMEVANLENKKVVTVEKFHVISDLYTAAKQGFRNTKHALEDDLRILIQEVEQIKIICQMNLDKMDYNLHVLRRREDKNRQTKNAMKRKLLKLQDQFSKKTILFKSIIVDAENKSNKLIKEINRLQDQCKNGSRNTLELVTNDYYKYMEMWIVNEETAREKLQKLVDSEKFIYETQLGIELPVTDIESLDSRPYEIQRFLERIHYVPPNLSRKRSDIYERYNDDFGSDADGSEQSITALKDHEAVYKTIGPVDPENYEAVEEEEEVTQEDDFNPKAFKGLLKQVSKFCDHTGFIIEEKLRRIVAPLQDLEQQLIRTDSLFQALGVTNVAQLEILAKYVAKHCKIIKTFTTKSRSQGADTSVDKLFDNANKEVKHTDHNIHPSDSSEAEASAHGKSSNAREEVEYITKTIENELGIEFDDNGDIIDPESKSNVKENEELLGEEVDETAEEEENPKKVTILIEAQSNDNKVEDIIIQGMTDEQVHEVIHLAAYPSMRSMHSPSNSSSSSSSSSVSSSSSSTSSSYISSCGSTTDVADSQIRNEIRHCKEEKERMRLVSLEGKDPGETFDVGEGQIGVSTEPGMRAAKLNYQKDDHKTRHKKKSNDYSASNIVAIPSIQDNVGTVNAKSISAIDHTHKHDVHHDLDHQHQHHQPDHHEHHHDHDHQEHHHDHHHDQHHDHHHEHHHDHHHDHHQEHRHSQYGRRHSHGDHRHSHFEHTRSQSELRPSHAEHRHSHDEHGQSYADVRLSHGDRRHSHGDRRHSHGDRRHSHGDRRHSHGEHHHHRHHHVEEEEFSDETPENESSTEDAVVSSTPSETTSCESIVEVDTMETAYIEPSDILTALTEFCQDFNSEIKMEIPTEEDIISKKLSLMQFPDASDTAEYWNRFYTLTDPKSKELWESIQYCFEQYSDALKKRNALVEEVTQLHQQNFELSHLLKKHMQRGVRFGSQPGGAGNIDLPHLPYC